MDAGDGSQQTLQFLVIGKYVCADACVCNCVPAYFILFTVSVGVFLSVYLLVFSHSFIHVCMCLSAFLLIFMCMSVPVRF